MALTRIWSHEQNHISAHLSILFFFPFSSFQKVTLLSKASLLKVVESVQAQLLILQQGDNQPDAWHGVAAVPAIWGGWRQAERGNRDTSEIGYFEEEAELLVKMFHWGMWTLPYQGLTRCFKYLWAIFLELKMIWSLSRTLHSFICN